MIGDWMKRMLTRASPKAKEAACRVDEALLAREDKRSAVSRLVHALDKIEIERDLSATITRPVEPRR